MELITPNKAAAFYFSFYFHFKHLKFNYYLVTYKLSLFIADTDSNLVLTRLSTTTQIHPQSLNIDFQVLKTCFFVSWEVLFEF